MQSQQNLEVGIFSIEYLTPNMLSGHASILTMPLQLIISLFHAAQVCRTVVGMVIMSLTRLDSYVSQALD